MNLASLLENEIEKFGEHVSTIYGDKHYTNVQMSQSAKRLANALQKLGVQKGDRVILQMPNCPEIIQSFNAIYSLGAIVVPINYMVGDSETRFIYKDTGAKVIISNMEFWDKIQTCKDGLDSIEHIILTDSETPDGALSYGILLNENSTDFEVMDVSQEDLAALIYTAGTTGNPKGVMHTHAGLLANAKMQHDTLEFESGMTAVTVLPLCHSYGISATNNSLLVGGMRTIMLEKLEIEAIFDAIQKYKADAIGAVPTLYVYMLAMEDTLKKYDISSMKYWVSGSAPLNQDTWNRFKEVTGGEIIEGWGLTEAGANNSINPIRGKKKIGSVGLPMKGTDMKVVDDQGNELQENEPGEILISGPIIMKGYWNNEEETARVIKDGWLYTGDIGYKDEDGYYYITDRKKDLIIKGGENIAPREVEEVLMAHPNVVEVAVIGIPDEVYGENIRAFAVKQPGQDVSENELIEYCISKLKRFKSPKEIIFLEALPKSLVGKILRKELRKM